MRKPKAEMQRQLRLALTFVLIFGGASAAWSVMAPLGSAIVTAGIVTAEGNLRKVQHQTGGVVGALFVTEGQHVNEGDLLVRLNDTDTRASLNIIENDLAAARARRARLEAEQAGLKAVTFPEELLAASQTSADVRHLLGEESNTLTARLTTREGQSKQMDERLAQLQEQIDGMQQQLDASKKGRSVAADEKQNLESLVAAHLVPRPRMTQLERELAQSDGTIGSSIARISELKGKIKETQLQKEQLDKDGQSEIAKDLNDTSVKIGELSQRQTSAKEQLRRIDVRAPITGKVHQLSIHTIGGVVTPTEPMMYIVPENERLIVEVKVNPQDIDQVQLGRDVRIRFTAFNKRTTPEVNGKVFRLDGDLTKDPQGTATYYLAGIAISDDELARLDGLKLLPGMPAEAFIVTGERTFASFIFKPITDQIQRAAREK